MGEGSSSTEVAEVKNVELNNNQSERRVSSPRFRAALRVFLEFFVNPSAISVSSKAHLKEIPSGRKVIFVTTHVTDIDVPATAYAMRDFNPVIAHHSTHEDFLKDPVSWMGFVIAGRKNFLPVEAREREGKVRGDFDPEDYVRMEQVLEDGRSLVIAGHNPTYDGKLSRKGGIAAAYLAQKTGALIVPVSVNLGAEATIGADILKTAIKKGIKDRKRPTMEISIGHPIDFTKFAKIDVQAMDNFLRKRKEGGDLSPEDIEEYRNVIRQLREQSSHVMSSLAAMLPPEKRGTWIEK